MNAENFERWFKEFLNKIEPNSVIVIGNAPYHCCKINNIPNSSWKKASIQQWLQTKQISYAQDTVRTELLQIVKQQDIANTYYAINNIANEKCNSASTASLPLRIKSNWDDLVVS